MDWNGRRNYIVLVQFYWYITCTVSSPFFVSVETENKFKDTKTTPHQVDIAVKSGTHSK
jgi:hypothetical protein